MPGSKTQLMNSLAAGAGMALLLPNCALHSASVLLKGVGLGPSKFSDHPTECHSVMRCHGSLGHNVLNNRP
jgi:hypothetical protein